MSEIDIQHAGTIDAAPVRVNLDRLLETCLVATIEFKHFLNEIKQPPSEDFLLDRVAFEKQAARLNSFDVGFGKVMNGREANEDWRCLQGMRTALSGLLLLLSENCYNADAPAMEEICEEFGEWIACEGAEAFEQVREVVEELRKGPARAYIDECSSPFIQPAYTPSDLGSESSMNSDSDYMTPLQSQSRVSSFNTVYSDDGTDCLVDLTAVIERFGVYNNVLVDSLELVGDILKWNYHSNLERFEEMTAGSEKDPLRCIQVQCEDSFGQSDDWKQHVENCSVRGVSFPVVTQGKTKFEAATLKCPIASCSAPFSTWEKLQQHQDHVHKIFMCSQSSCGVAFFSRDLAKEHNRCVHASSADLKESWMIEDISKLREQPITFVPESSHLVNLHMNPPEFLRRSGTLPTPTSPSKGPNFDFDFGQPGLLRQPTYPSLGRSRSQSDVKAKAPASKRDERQRPLPMQRARSSPGLNRQRYPHQRSESIEGIILILRAPFLY